MNQHRKELIETEENKLFEIRIDDEFRLAISRSLKCGEWLYRNCASARILAGSEPYSEGDSRGETSIETYLEVLPITQRNRLFKTAKPLFIGSIPIAASK